MANFDDSSESASGGMNEKGDTGSGFASYVNSLFDPSLTWSIIDWLKTVTKLPIILKGILTAEDAKVACKYNVAAIIVSNHGARQLDSAPATDAAKYVAGQAGVNQVLDILNNEFQTTMALSGCRSLEDIRDKNRKLVVHETHFASRL
uniref:FMN hydroxy acid dehydrogenase domain-containing protein n=1 Tax=Romanomermis culicivorax TaxID=13658 RepID=A0A915J787_ROMCU